MPRYQVIVCSLARATGAIFGRFRREEARNDGNAALQNMGMC